MMLLQQYRIVIFTLRPNNPYDMLQCLSELEDRIEWTKYGSQGKQVGLQYQLGEDPWMSGVGSRSGNDLLVTELNPLFVGTPFQQVIDEYGLIRTRLMWMSPRSCYSMHRDATPRIHVPLITSHQSYFCVAHLPLIHMSPEYVWAVDTTLLHTAVNCSDQPRLHLVGAVEILPVDPSNKNSPQGLFSVT